jgi:hypothetical protein
MRHLQAVYGAVHLFVCAVLLAPPALADKEIKLKNWSAPPFWTPAAAEANAVASPAGSRQRYSGRQVLALPSSPLPFVAVTPCRVIDTRGLTPPTPPYGAPLLSPGAPREFSVTGGGCGIPVGAGAVSTNATVTGTGGPGYLTLGVGGASLPYTSTLNFTAAGQTIANAAVVPLSSTGTIEALTSGSSVHFILDVNGYYAGTSVVTSLNSLTGNVTLSPGSNVTITPSGNTLTIGASGLTLPYVGTVSSGNPAFNITNSGSGAAIAGYGGGGSGVYGQSTTYPGVFGASTSNDGVVGSVASGHNGVSGVSTSGRGVYGGSTSGPGVYGESSNSYGIQGVSQGASPAAGVYGVDLSGAASGTGGYAAGVLGSSHLNVGVQGDSDNGGVRGEVYNGKGTYVALGILGLHSLNYYGVWSTGDFGGTGNKYFVEPHPTDASRVIRYICMEGPEAGTYFRGTGRTVGGQAVIEVPESFRMVTDEEGITAQVTATGRTRIWVESEDLNQIVVRSDDDVRFHYLVQGIRRAFKGFEPIVEGEEFAPSSPKDVMAAGLPEESKKRLIANGTYNADGTVNMTTAERLGWAQKWREEELLRQQAVSRTAEEPGKSPQQ